MKTSHSVNLIRNYVTALLSLILLAVPNSFAAASIAPGELDLNFKWGGYAISPFHGSASASVVQADGKIVVVGRGSASVFQLLRYNPDATIDTTFGINGTITTDVEGDNEIPYAAAVQADGKIVVVGQFQNVPESDYDFGIVRYNPDGSLDNSFGTNGKVAVRLSSAEDVARSIVIQPDGKLLIAGQTPYTDRPPYGPISGGGFGLVRLNQNGTFDFTFDGDGKIVLPQNGFFTQVAVQPDGKIVSASAEGYANESKIVVSRINTDGSNDLSFGSNGRVVTTIPGRGSGTVAAAVQADGKIVAGGTSGFFTSIESFTLVRLLPDGTLDTSFDGDGKVVTTLDVSITMRGMALQPDGKIVAFGNSHGRGVVITRYNGDGSLDFSFGTQGISSAIIHNIYAYDLKLQPDGKMIITGQAGSPYIHFLTVRFTSSGALDQDFNSGPGGRTFARLGEVYIANDVAVQPDGKIVTAGFTSNLSYRSISLARFHPDGSPDLSFGYEGKVTSPISQSSDAALTVTVQPDGKIVAAGYGGFLVGGSNVSAFVIVRYNRDGSLDKTLNDSGFAVYQKAFYTGAATSVIVQPDGKTVVTGYNHPLNGGGTDDFFLARFTLAGKLDTSFGTNGIVSTNIEGVSNDLAQTVLLQPDGKLIVVGTTLNGDNGDFAAVRYNADGSLDSTFATNGKVVTPLGSGKDEVVAAVLQPNGKILVVGNSTEGSNNRIALVRYNADGTLDNSFGLGGKMITALFDNLVVKDGAFNNGKIAVTADRPNGESSDILVAVFDYNGALDQNFGMGGIVATDIDNRRDVAGGIAFQGNNKLIVAGGSYFSQNPALAEMIVLRYQSTARAMFDFDGDGRSDISVFRPSNAAWYVNGSSNGFTGIGFGLETDALVPADYDGDGKTDVAVFRQGFWYLLQSFDNQFRAAHWGQNDDIPVPADYDGDFKADLAVFRKGFWYILQSSDNQFRAVHFGISTDKPVPADFDGDNKTDIAVFRDGNWYYLQSSDNQFRAVQFGIGGDKPVVGDYDGDAKADQAVLRNGVWYLNRSRDGFTGVQFGNATDIPTPADYDGDSKTDISVFREGVWYRLNSSNNQFVAVQFGVSTDKTVPSSFLP